MTRKFLLIHLLCLYMAHATLFSQTYPFSVYSVNDGLNESNIFAICQDRNGFLWIGTGGGVSKYDGRDFVNYTLKDGLGDNVVYTICEDTIGNLWFGTDVGGVSVLKKGYNQHTQGKIFKTYSVKEGLASLKVPRIRQAKNGNLLIGTGQGLSIVNYQDLKRNHIVFNNIKPDKEDKNNHIMAMYDDSLHNLWLGTYFNGVYFLHAEREKNKYTIRHFGTGEGLTDNKIWVIEEDTYHNIWLGSDKGISIMPSQKEKNYTFQIKKLETPEMKNQSVRTFYHNQSEIWCGTHSGIYKILLGRNIFTEDSISVKRFSTLEGLSANSVWAFYVDDEKNYWIGTFGEGLNKLRNETFSSIYMSQGLSKSQVLSLAIDRNNYLWVGVDAGKIFIYDLADNGTLNSQKPIYVMDSAFGLPGKSVLALFNDGETVWAGILGHGAWQYEYKEKNISTLKIKQHLTENNGLSHNNVTDFYKDHLNKLWLGTYGGICLLEDSLLLNRTPRIYIRRTGLKSPRVFDLSEDHKNNIWVTTPTGFARLNSLLHKNNGGIEFERYSTHNLDMKNNRFNNLLIDPYNNLILGSYGEGIFIVQTINNLIKVKDRITVEDGLSDDMIKSMIFDKEGNLWVGTNKGINKIDMNQYYFSRKKIIRNYGLLEGFTGVDCNLNAVCSDNNGRLYFGTNKGVMIYNPVYDKANTCEPKIHIQNIRIFFKPIHFSDYSSAHQTEAGLPGDLKLPYTLNHITFDFIGVSLSVPQKVKYQYLLEGYDKNWSPVTGNNIATYTSLEPGKYSFKVKAANNDDLWNKTPATFSFTISPPYWETWWFYSLQISFLAILVGASFKVGHSKTNTRVATILIFICIFILFEYVQTLLEPYFVLVVGGAPFFKVLMNLILAVILFPLEKFIRKYLEGGKERYSVGFSH